MMNDITRWTAKGAPVLTRTQTVRARVDLRSGMAGAAGGLVMILALAVGVALSFTVIGLFVATVGFAAGIDADVFQRAAATLLVLIGVVLLWYREA